MQDKWSVPYVSVKDRGPQTTWCEEGKLKEEGTVNDEQKTGKEERRESKREEARCLEAWIHERTHFVSPQCEWTVSEEMRVSGAMELYDTIWRGRIPGIEHGGT